VKAPIGFGAFFFFAPAPQGELLILLAIFAFMFNFSKNKKTETKIKDIIWINSDAKWKGLEDLWRKDPNTVFVFWFDESLEEAKSKVSDAKIEFASAREVNHHLIPTKPVIFAEHYPLQKKEQELFQQLQLKEVKVLSALDEPLFKKFGADKIIDMLKHMGMKENDPLENQLITNAIKNAQQKLEKQVIIEHSAPSQRSWLEKNLPSEKNY